MTANELSKDEARKSRIAAIENGAVLNSPGILKANDTWVWESDWEEYKALPPCQDASNLVNGRTIYLIGDSLTRQWAKVIRCEFQHSFNMSAKEAESRVRYLQEHTAFPKPARLKTFLSTATAQDYLVFNLGHHIQQVKMGDQWKTVYKQELSKALTASFGKIPTSHVFFRTTSVRHFLRGIGDFDTYDSKAGGAAPNMMAKWSFYGGNYPNQPEQNLLALDIFENTSMNILDVSPMMLARGDASFDGSHFCLPGPMEFWSRMLYYRMQQTKSD
jgi:hypothetical protein